MGSRILATLAVVALVPATAACSSTAHGPRSAPVRPVAYERVPADRITVEVFRSDALRRLEYAESDRRADCLSRRGYPQLAAAGPQRGEDPFAGMNVAAPAYATADEQRLRRTGFGRNEPAKAAHVLSYHRGFDRAFERCTQEVHRGLGPDFADVRERAYALMNTVTDELSTGSTTGAGAAEYREISVPVLDCLDRAGFRPRPGERERHLRAYGVGVPTGTLTGAPPAPPKRVPGTIEVLPAVPERVYVPTPAEVALAVATNRCARATGYADRYVELRLRDTRRSLERHAADLGALAAQVDTFAARLD
ncbi:hypothetical protein AB0J86_17860 [Micromonospora sp. NPDC049559]|uniref:hypothetical protein n=1 Tax=Micromonospora sp. NPDC049559 TaxID=3155923 RepID=UPI00342E1208